MTNGGLAHAGRIATLPLMQDPYLVLQVSRDADASVIRASFRALARRHHPDFGGDEAQMVALNEAWRILGNVRRRAAYDAASRLRQPDASVVAAGPGSSGAERGPAHAWSAASGRESGTILDFGRYAGWSIGRLADHDPDYLEWLARAPIGRHLAAEIRALLTQRAGVATATPPLRGARRQCR